MAAHLLEASADDVEFEAGQFRVRGTDRSITMVDTAKAFYAPFLPLGVTLGLQATASSTA
jgi:carbon-monoxide dehydrogenase large subunit